MIAATSLAGASLSNSTSSNQRRSSTRPNGAWKTPGRSGPNPAWYFAFDAVSETEPYVRPWNAPRNATTYGRFVAKRASLIAASTTSVPAVAEIDAGLAARDRRDLGEASADLGVDRQVEVGRREVDQLGCLLLDRRHDLRVRVAGRVDGDAGGEVEEQVAVDVLDRQAFTADGNDRVGPREARRRPRLVESDVGAGLRAGELRDDVGNGSRSRQDVREQRPTWAPRAHRKYADWIFDRQSSRGSDALEGGCEDQAGRRRRLRPPPRHRGPREGRAHLQRGTGRASRRPRSEQ